jgi:hypothetical protein
VARPKKPPRDLPVDPWRVRKRTLARQYWQQLIASAGSVVLAAKYGKTNRTHTFKILQRYGVKLGCAPPDELIPKQELAPWLDYIKRREREYWLQLIERYSCMTDVAFVADMDRPCMYRHFATVGLDLDQLRQMQGRKKYGGNAAWLSLSDREGETCTMPPNEPGAPARRLTRPGSYRPTTGADSHGARTESPGR